MKSHLLDAESPKPDFIVYILFLFLIYLSFFEYEQQIGFLVYGLVVTAENHLEHGTNLFQIQKLLGLVESTLKRSSELVTSDVIEFLVSGRI